MTTINDLLLQARTAACQRQAVAQNGWRILSVRLGSLRPSSLLLVSIHKDGEVDLIIRCIEDEIVELQPRINAKAWKDFDIDFVNTLVRYWIGSMYETFRILKNLASEDDIPQFHEIYHDLRLIRVPLEKHEIALDQKLQGALRLQRTPSIGDPSDEFIYDPKNPLRSHIMPQGVCEFCGSIMWDAIDGATAKPFRISRRGISDRILALANIPISTFQTSTMPIK